MSRRYIEHGTVRMGVLAAAGIAAAAVLGLRAGPAPRTSPHLTAERTAILGTPGHSAAFARVDLRELASQAGAATEQVREVEEEREQPVFKPRLPLPEKALLRPEVVGLAPEAAQAPRIASPPLASSFQALSETGTAFPPDTQGAAGPNHVVTTLNTQTRVQDRSGKELLTLSFDAFWAKVAGGLSLSDPKITYEPVADRWIAAAVAAPNTSDASVLVGVSQTGDPTGTWNLYSVAADAQGKLWADFPTLGFNKDWIAIQVNMWTVASSVDNSQFQETHIYVFDKANLLAGGADARHTLFATAEFGTGQVPAETYDPAEPVLYLLEDWNGNADGLGSLRLFSISGPVGSEEFRSIGFPVTDAVWDDSPPNGSDFAPQMGTAAKIATQGGDFTQVVLRNGLITAAQTIFLPSGAPQRASVQWWQLTRDGFIVARGRVDDPTNQNFYAFPTAAPNRVNDVLVGFSAFSAQQFASGGYAFRAAADAAGTLRDPASLKSGEAIYIKTGGGRRNRWGDYSSTVFDPVNGLDFWTIQEYAAKSAAQAAGSWSTWWGRVAADSGSAVAMPTGAFTGPASAVAGQSVAFTDGSTGATKWFWDFGDGTSSTDRNPTHAFGFDGTLTVTENAVNQTGAVSASRTIVIAPPPKVVPEPIPGSRRAPREVPPRR